jgi:hypothetical protein
MSFLVKAPKLSAPAAQQQQMPSYQEAEPVPLGYGRALLAAHWLSDAFNWREAPAGKNEPNWQYASIAFALGAGPIDYVGLIKRDGKAIWHCDYTFAAGEDYHDFVINPSLALGQPWLLRVYRGTETQLPDSTLSAGTGQAHPAYRGLAYAVMTNIDLGQGNTTIPSFAIEVGRRAPAIGADAGAGSAYGVNPFSAIYGLLREDRGGDCAAELLDAAHWGAVSDALWTGGIHTRTGEQVLIHPWFRQGTSLSDALSQILAYCDGYLYAAAGQLRAGWFPGGLPTGSLPEIAEADLEEKPSGGGFPDWNQAATSIAVVFTDAAGRDYEDGAATYQAPANRETGLAAAPQRKDRPFVHFADQAQRLAIELASGAADDTTVTLQVLKSRATRLDLTPLQPGDLLRWTYGPHGLQLVCRVLSRRIRAGSASDLLEVLRERGAFPAPHVPMVDDRVPYVPSLPADVAHHRLWFLPPGFGGGRQITCLVDRPAPQNTATRLHLSATGSAPWEPILTLRSFAARCTLDTGLSGGAGTVRVASTSLDFARMQAQSALAQKDDTLLLLVDDEVLSVGSITVVSAGVYDLGVLRGRLGSIAAAHAGAAEAWLCYYEEIQPTTHEEFYDVRQSGVYDSARATKHFKLQAISADGSGTPQPNDPGIAWTLPDLTEADSAGTRTFYGPNAPTGDLRVGDLWFKTVAGKVVATYRWNGSAWVDVSDTRIEDNDAAVRALIDAVEATVNGLIADTNQLADDLLAEVAARQQAIIDEATARTSADSAITSSLNALSADYNGNKATVASQLSSIVSVNNAQASDLSTLFVQMGTANSQISSLSTALADETSTRASQVSSLQSQLNGLDSSVSILAAAYIVGGQAVATWGFKLDAHGKVVGIQAIAASGGGQAEAGVIVFSGADLRSDNFVAGESGWRIKADGTVEFSEGVFRGGLQIAAPHYTPGYGNTDTGLAVEYGTNALFISRSDVFGLSLNRNSSNGAVAIFHRDGSQVGEIWVSSSGTSFVTSSDRRLKRGIAPAPDVGALIDSLMVREYEFAVEPGVRRLGFIAQEVHQRYPEAVSAGDDGADPHAPGAVIWGIDHARLVPLLVREIQSLRLRVASLES